MVQLFAMRLFTAIELQPELSDALIAMQDRLKTAAPEASVKWTERASFHLTVQFLGELPASTLSGVTEACEFLAPQINDFRFCAFGGSHFPKVGDLKTLWVGLTEGADAWKRLVQLAEPWFTPLGAPKNGGLVPHITLGRVKTHHETLRQAMALETKTEIGTQNAVALTLIESQLSPSGATYIVQGRWPLKK
jgi:RNA 2',3'-cyclic 3'-phosphodiesterase